MNDPTTELGKACEGRRKAAKEAEEFLLRTKGISIKQKRSPRASTRRRSSANTSATAAAPKLPRSASSPRPQHRPEDPRGKLGHRQEEHLRRR